MHTVFFRNFATKTRASPVCELNIPTESTRMGESCHFVVVARSLQNTVRGHLATGTVYFGYSEGPTELTRAATKQELIKR